MSGSGRWTDLPLAVSIGAAWTLTAALAIAAVSSSSLLFLPAAAVGIGVIWLLVRRFGIGVVISLLILAGMNLLPGPDLSVTLRNSVTYQDVGVLLLAATLLYVNYQQGFALLLQSRAGRGIIAWCLLFGVWYAYTLAHTWVTTPVPLLHAITFSRQFIYMILLFPLLLGPLQDRKLRSCVFVVVGVGLVMSSLAQIATVAAGVSLPALVHIPASGDTAGVTRIRGAAAEAPFVALPFGYGLILYGYRRIRVWIGAALATTGIIGVAVSLTRALYVGVAAGLVIATLLALLARGSRANVGRRRLLQTLLGVCGISVVLYLYLPSTVAQKPLTAVEQRATSLVAYLSGGTLDSSLETRSIELSSIEFAIRGHWWTGLGELDPTYDYVGQGGVLQGNIDNGDVSLLGTVALIGIVGVVIYALPVFAILIGLVRRCTTARASRDDDWLLFGGLGWCISVLVVAPTIGFLVAPSEVVGSALVLALLSEALSDDEPPARRSLPVRASARGN